MNPIAFSARTRSLDKRLRLRLGEFDVVLQIGGLFAPFKGSNPVPVAIFCDYTTKLAELNYAPWCRLSGQKLDLWYQMEAELYQQCAIIFTASANTKKSIVNDYQVEPDRVCVVGEGVDSVHRNHEKKYEECTVLFVGIDFERKGGPTLLKAFSEVKARLPRARLLIAGPRAGDEQEGVEWLGHVKDRKQLEHLFTEATVFAMPSVCEPFGLVLIEAMSHELPVVGSTADAMPEIIDEGRTGYTVPVEDSGKLAERLIQLLASPEMCKEFGRAGCQKVENQFLWSSVVMKIEGELKGIVNS
jgi:glycosyltransferase involved in cell wall biosynthesis